MRLYALIFSALIVGFSGSAFADSLWSNSAQSLYSANHPHRVGDVITVYISESASAIQEAGTNTSKQSSFGANFFDSWNMTGAGNNDQTRRSQDYRLGGQDSYQGMGKTSRTSQVKGVVSAMVTEILPNGNLYLVGEHQVKVNDETETIRIEGQISPSDVTADNSVFSYQLAKAEISVKGTGVVGSKQTPGMLTKVLNWLF